MPSLPILGTVAFVWPALVAQLDGFNVRALIKPLSALIVLAAIWLIVTTCCDLPPKAVRVVNIVGGTILVLIAIWVLASFL